MFATWAEPLLGSCSCSRQTLSPTQSDPLQIVSIRACLCGRDACADSGRYIYILLAYKGIDPS